MKQTTIFLVLLTVLLGVGSFFSWREHTAAQRLQTELIAAKAQLSELEKLRAELDRLAAENQRLRAEAVDPSELARLRALANDLRRLQQEKVALEKTLTTANVSRVAKATVELETSPTKAQPLRGGGTVAKGQSLLTRGWQPSSGNPSFAILTPTHIGRERTTIQVKWIAAASGLDWLNDPSQTSAIVSSEEATKVISAVFSKHGGEPLLLSDIETKYLPANAYLAVPSSQSDGKQILLSPQLSADGQSVDLGFVIQESETQLAR